MKFIDIKRSVEIIFLTLGFVLLISAISLLNKPTLNQGVAASSSQTTHASMAAARQGR